MAAVRGVVRGQHDVSKPGTALRGLHIPRQVVVSFKQMKHGLAVATVRTLYRLTSLGGPGGAVAEADITVGRSRAVVTESEL